MLTKHSKVTIQQAPLRRLKNAVHSELLATCMLCYEVYIPLLQSCNLHQAHLSRTADKQSARTPTS